MRNKRTTLLSLSALGLAAACATGPLASAGQPLTDRELHKLFSTGAVVRALPHRPDGTPFTRAYYYSNGKYQDCGHFAAIDGSYSIGNSEICITARGRNFCRRIMMLANGSFSIATPPYTKERLAKPTLVSVERGADNRSCDSTEH